MVTFCRIYERYGVVKGQTYRVDGIGCAANRISLRDRNSRAIDAECRAITVTDARGQEH